jgi:hypothetical protein
MAQRRNPLRLIIHKDIQLRILAWVLGAIFACLGLAIGLLALRVPLLWVAVVVVGVSLFAALYVSRQIAGPFYRIEQDLEDWMQGALEGRRIQLRKDDSAQRLAMLINQLIERIR